MEIIYLLIAISLILVVVIICTFFWAVGSGQYEDLERESHRILMDDDDINGGDAASEDQPDRQPGNPSNPGGQRDARNDPGPGRPTD